TGTARVPDTVHGGYLPGAYVGSFIGFAPAERPQVVVAGGIDRPTRGYYGGAGGGPGWTEGGETAPRRGGSYDGSGAAPVFKGVASTALRRLGVVPTLPAKAVR